jgi:hypothetical protein
MILPVNCTSTPLCYDPSPIQYIDESLMILPLYIDFLMLCPSTIHRLPCIMILPLYIDSLVFWSLNPSNIHWLPYIMILRLNVDFLMLWSFHYTLTPLRNDPSSYTINPFCCDPSTIHWLPCVMLLPSYIDSLILWSFHYSMTPFCYDPSIILPCVFNALIKISTVNTNLR